MTKRTTTSTNPQKNAALAIVAAGSSQRMGSLGKKEYLPLNGGSVLSETALVFLKTKVFSTIALVYPKGGLADAKNAFYKNPQTQELSQGVNIIFVQGGSSRQESVFNALKAIDRAAKKTGATPPRAVLIHDGARPFLSQALVKKTLASALKYGAAVPALEPVETQKEIGSGSKIARHLKRSTLAAVQTPQGFLFPQILEFHRKAQKTAAAFTDDTEIWDKFSDKKTRIIPGEPQNIKITYPKDLGATIIDAPKKERVKALSGARLDRSYRGAGLDCQRSQERSEIISSSKISEATYRSYQNAAAPKAEKTIRIGLGTDLHRLVKGRKLILGGIRFPFEKGEDGHSDGDALLHAVTDALLGAAALGDIGSYFPPSDPKWKDADSKKLLAAVWKDVKKEGWRLENLDCVIHLQEPKFLPRRQEVRESIAKVLGVDLERVFVKAKTGERVGPVGEGLAVETQAICLLSKIS